MEIIKIENLSFTYPGQKEKTLSNVNLSVQSGEFLTLCGKSGCGKTTLLHLIKPMVAPYGDVEGSVSIDGENVLEYSVRKQAEKIGFVMQNPDNQIVTDKVWHELAFGLENLGYSSDAIRIRTFEMASFFGMQSWFYKDVCELSGGQKQILNLASVMAMSPSVLILDEPTSQLDPVAAHDFLKILEKINLETGTTVILTEHRLDEAFAISDRVAVMDKGEIIACDKPEKIGKILMDNEHELYDAMPVAIRVYTAVENGEESPVNVRDARVWLEDYANNNTLNKDIIQKHNYEKESEETAIEIKDAWFRYEKNTPDVIKGLNMSVKTGEIYAIMGANASGKTTALSMISGIRNAYRGKVYIGKERVIPSEALKKGVIGMLSQNPQTMFVAKSVILELEDMLENIKISEDEKKKRITEVSDVCRINHLLTRHPYDLSGGEAQRVAFAKILLQNPDILLLDEPTKGMDAVFKEEYADILKTLTKQKKTVVMVSHDIEFCAEHADRCAMFFDGEIVSCADVREFFANNNFYTTSAARIGRSTIPEALLAEDIIRACGKNAQKRKREKSVYEIKKDENKDLPETPKKVKKGRCVCGAIFAIMFALICALFAMTTGMFGQRLFPYMSIDGLQIAGFACAAISLFCFFPGQKNGLQISGFDLADRKNKKKNILTLIVMLFVIPLTVYGGLHILGDRRFYIVSIIVIIETIIPFFMIFESRKPQAREIVIISVICAIAVAGRAAFFMIPQFKPVVAIVIIAGVCFGAETGFLVGAISAFVSNFFFGQGPWTPWQMFAFGMVGLISPIIFKRGAIRITRVSLSIFGFVSAYVIYGAIMNISNVLLVQNEPTWEMFLLSFATGVPFDLAHGLSGAFFLWFIGETMIEKIERIKTKYGIMQR